MQPQAPDEYTVGVGRVVAAFGIRGEVKLLPETDWPERFRPGAVFSLDPPGRLFAIETVRPHQGALLVRFEGVADRNAAEGLHGAMVRCRPSERAPLEENELYVTDLLGLDVVTDQGRELGEIEEVLRGAAHDVYRTARAMIPAVDGEFVLSVDLAAGRMVVRDVPGLLPDEQEEVPAGAEAGDGVPG